MRKVKHVQRKIGTFEKGAAPGADIASPSENQDRAHVARPFTGRARNPLELFSALVAVVVHLSGKSDVLLLPPDLPQMGGPTLSSD